MNIMKTLECNIEKAKKGRDIWIKLKKYHTLGNHDFVILMPTDQKIENYYTLLYLKRFANYKNAHKIIILTFDKSVIASARIFWERKDSDIFYDSKILEVLEYSKEQLEDIMWFYSLYPFSEHLIIAALDEPLARNATWLIEKGEITMDQAFVYAIYEMKTLKNFEAVSPLNYVGNNKLIREFLKT